MAFSLGAVGAICRKGSERVVADDRATRKDTFSLFQKNRKRAFFFVEVRFVTLSMPLLVSFGYKEYAMFYWFAASTEAKVMSILQTFHLIDYCVMI